MLLKARKESEQKAGLLLDLDMDKVTKIIIEKPGGMLKLAKHEADWRIEEPIQVDANDIDVNDIVQVASELNFDREMGRVEDLSQYSLDNPTVVSFEQSDGHLQTLNIGAINPAKTGFYVTVGDEPNVFIIKRWQASGMLKNEFDLREKRLFFHQPDAVSKFSLRNSQLSINVEKNDKGEWAITSPIEDSGDVVAIKALLDRVVPTLISGFIEHNPTDLSQYGLAQPDTTITLHFDNEPEPATLYIGGATAGENRYAMLKDGTQVIRIPGEVAGAAQINLNSLRNKTLAPVQPEDINEITITLEGNLYGWYR